jgi:hypothetical protein
MAAHTNERPLCDRENCEQCGGVKNSAGCLRHRAYYYMALSTRPEWRGQFVYLHERSLDFMAKAANLDNVEWF